MGVTILTKLNYRHELKWLNLALISVHYQDIGHTSFVVPGVCSYVVFVTTKEYLYPATAILRYIWDV